MTDGIMTRHEEKRLRAFRDYLALEDNAPDQDVIWDLEQAFAERVNPQACLNLPITICDCSTKQWLRGGQTPRFLSPGRKSPDRDCLHLPVVSRVD